MIESISAITLATHDMARATKFYRALGFELLYSGDEVRFHHRSRHSTYKPACILVLDQGQPDADMAAAGSRTSQMSGNFIEAHVAVIDLDKKLHRALQPDM